MDAYQKLIEHFSSSNISVMSASTANKPATLSCSKHGEWTVSRASTILTAKSGCAKCSVEQRAAKHTKDPQEALEEHFKGSFVRVLKCGPKSNDPVLLLCSVHGEFSTKNAISILHQKSGCSKCSRNKRDSLRAEQTAINVKELANTMGYELISQVGGASGKTTLLCPSHGEFTALTVNFLKGSKCHKCSYAERGLSKRIDPREALEEHFKDKEITIVSCPDFTKGSVVLSCSKHGEWITDIQSVLYYKTSCPRCTTQTSSIELKLFEFVKSICPDAIHRDRSVIKNPITNYRQELDIYIPSKQIAFEINGLYWHSTAVHPSPSHSFNKYKLARANGIQLFTLFEDELVNLDLIKSMIEAKLGKSNKSIFARKTVVRAVSSEVAKEFYNTNHIQGFAGGTHTGLYYNEELIACMTFKNNSRLFAAYGAIELNRFAVKQGIRVVGGFTKLLKASGHNKIVSLSDNRYSDGGVYKNNGFTLVNESGPDYKYIIKGKRVHKTSFAIGKLRNKGLAPPEETEFEAMDRMGHPRIYDCGKKTWLYATIATT